jgi:hypothetical protein
MKMESYEAWQATKGWSWAEGPMRRGKGPRSNGRTDIPLISHCERKMWKSTHPSRKKEGLMDAGRIGTRQLIVVAESQSTALGVIDGKWWQRK